MACMAWEASGVATVLWGPEVAETYDASSASMFDPAVLDPTVDLLAELAEGGHALEFAVGTGRVALALQARGVSVAGIELSEPMVAQLRAKPGAQTIPVTIGDMTSTRVAGEFALVYLVFNTIMNVTTQAEQVAVFENAAAHLRPGGRFVVEVVVPQIRRLVPGELGRVFDMSPEHVGIETFDDLVGQISWSHHWGMVDGQLVRASAPYRFVWASELDLMARIAGLRHEGRWEGWRREPFTNDSPKHVSVWSKPPA
jgi:SAM-dependent methyltransferase